MGFVLDQIRANGEKKELVDEVIAAWRRSTGITTPYTSYLIIPDAALPVAASKGLDGKPNVSFYTGATPAGTPGLGGRVG